MQPKYKESYPGFCRAARNISGELAAEYETKVQGYKKAKGPTEFEILFHECFEHHVTEAAYELYGEFELTGDDRVVQLDNITASFLASYYKPPSIAKTDSPVLIERQRNLVSYSVFYEAITRSAITTKLQNTERLGSTKISYLIGDVGIGKSTLLAKVLFDLHREMSLQGRRIIPVSFCFESNWERIHADFFEDIDDRFWRSLFRTMLDECKEFSKRTCLSMEDFYLNPNSEPPIESIKSLASYLHKQNYRIFLALDNIDRYYFSYSKYSFFEKYNKERAECIDRNVREVIQTFEAERKLGYSGLSIVIACRDYVYKNIPLSAAKEAPHIPSSDVYQIDKPDESLVVGARFQLLADIIEKIKADDPKQGVNFERASKSLECYLDAHPGTASPGLQAIINFCQQGHRSLVEFMAGLRVDYQHDEVLNRIFKKHSSLLVILYMTNGYKRYTQKERLFPNMFLVDALVDPVKGREEAHKAHKHTYWLKYFILKYLYVHQESSVVVDVGDIIKIFSGEGKYEEELVRLALGSLCSEDEYRCVDVIYNTPSRTFEDRRLKLTTRGEELLKTNQKLFSQRETPIEYCFSFLYLHVIIDDYLMALPISVYEKIVNMPSFSHLYLPDQFYGAESSNHIVKRANAVICFLGTIFAALEAENKHKKRLFDELENLGIIPNPGDIYSAIDEEIEIIASHITKLRNWESVKNGATRVMNELSPVFEKHYSSQDCVGY